MEELLKKDFLNVINSVRRGDAPEWTAEATVRVENISDHFLTWTTRKAMRQR